MLRLVALILLTLASLYKGYRLACWFLAAAMTTLYARWNQGNTQVQKQKPQADGACMGPEAVGSSLQLPAASGVVP